MRSLRSRLPPMKSLVAFEVVARYLSFTKAGRELCISREAVSRQIRILEEHLGVQLFNRLHRAVSLTRAGRDFLMVVQSCLEDIAEVSDRLQGCTGTRKISICSTIAISSFWLTPRILNYRSLFPDSEISVSVTDSPVDMVADGIDLGFRYGSGDWPGLATTRLFSVDSFPVCAPSYLSENPSIRNPFDLLGHQLVNLDGDMHADEGWRWWLTGHGVTLPQDFRSLGFDSYANVLQVALDGRGVALGFSGLSSELLEQKRLVRPLPESLQGSGAVYLVTPENTQLPAHAQQFIDWILEEHSYDRIQSPGLRLAALA